MQDDEAVVGVVVVGNEADDLGPGVGPDVGRIHRRIEGDACRLMPQPLQLGDVLLNVPEVEGLQRARFGVLHHTDGAPGVNQQDG